MKRVSIYVWLLFLLTAIITGCNEQSVMEGGFPETGKEDPAARKCYSGFNVKNYWKLNYMVSNTTSVFMNNSDRFQWTFEPVEGTSKFYIRQYDENYIWGGLYLIRSTGGQIALSGIPQVYTDGRSEWIIESVSSGELVEPGSNNAVVHIKSAETGINSYLNIETGNLLVGPILPGWQSAMWIISGKPMGQVIFYTTKSFNCGNITVKVSDKRTIVKTVSSSAPSCSQNSAGTLRLPPCTYEFIAFCASKSWKGTFSITSGECTIYKLE